MKCQLCLSHFDELIISQRHGMTCEECLEEEEELDEIEFWEDLFYHQYDDDDWEEEELDLY
jgi:hypothetical protein